MLRKKGQIITNKTLIDNLLTRGVEEIFPNKNFLEGQLKSGKRLTLYLGIDPTGPTLHTGHAIPLKKLREFQDLGHKIILLIGDFTAMIGDPDKTTTRKQLTRKEVLKNATLYKKQASKFLRFSGLNPAELKYNSKWLSKMKFEDVLELASHMTVEQMSKRDMFMKRTKEGKPVYIHEFMYPLMQGYDSVAMNVDGEVGGNDQMFNMLAGRTLMKQMQNKEKFVITMKLLEDPSGRKMGKTEGNMVTMEDNANEMFGKVMSWTDGMIIPGFELCTNATIEEIEDIKKNIKFGSNPREWKMSLAESIIEIYHNKEEAIKAKENFINTFSKGEMSDDVGDIFVVSGVTISTVLLNNNLVSSKNELRRLVSEGAVTNLKTGEKISDPDMEITEDTDLKIGKRRFAKLRIQK